MTNFILNKAERAKAITFEGRYKDCKVYILAKEAVSSNNKPIVQFFLGCELYQDFKAVYEIPEGTEINTEKGFFSVAHQLLHDNIEEIVEKKFEGGVDYRDIYENDATGNNAEDEDEQFFV